MNYSLVCGEPHSKEGRLNSYEWNQHGFVILENFFSPEDLRDLSLLADQNVKRGGPDVYPTFAVAQYDLIQPAHVGKLPYLGRMSQAVEKVMGMPASFYLNYARKRDCPRRWRL